MELNVDITQMRELTANEVDLVAGGEDLWTDSNGMAWVSYYRYVDATQGQVLGWEGYKQDPDTGRWIDTGIWKAAGGGEPKTVEG